MNFDARCGIAVLVWAVASVACVQQFPHPSDAEAEEVTDAGTMLPDTRVIPDLPLAPDAPKIVRPRPVAGRGPPPTCGIPGLGAVPATAAKAAAAVSGASASRTGPHARPRAPASMARVEAVAPRRRLAARTGCARPRARLTTENMATSRCHACGGAEQPCCGDGYFVSGTVCDRRRAGGTCAACGAHNQPCCAGRTCGGGGCCAGDGKCVAAGKSCGGGTVCAAGRAAERGPRAGAPSGEQGAATPPRFTRRDGDGGISGLAPGGTGSADRSAERGTDARRSSGWPRRGSGCRATLWREKARVASGELEQVSSLLPSAVVPPCPLFGRCGGCQWQHVGRRRR